VPKCAGIYAWYFDDLSPELTRADVMSLTVARCCTSASHRERFPSTARLQADRRCASGSGRITVATPKDRHCGLTLGCAGRLNLSPRRVGSGSRYTFTNPGECSLDAWMAQNAFVTWSAHEQPWTVEHQMLTSGLVLPLNIHGNPRPDLSTVQSSIRCDHRRIADTMPVIADGGGPRRPVLIKRDPTPV
jgi:hypothetical protein